MLLLYFIKYNWFCAIILSIANKIDPDNDRPVFDDLPSLPNVSKSKNRIFYKNLQKPRTTVTPQYRSQRNQMRPQNQYTNGPRPLNPVTRQSSASSCSDYSDYESCHPKSQKSSSLCNIC